MKVLKQKWMSLHPRPELSQNLLTRTLSEGFIWICGNKNQKNL
jgi:hypothetical protein